MRKRLKQYRLGFYWNTKYESSAAFEAISDSFNRWKHMRTLAGASNQVCFTNLSSSAALDLNKLWNGPESQAGEAPVCVLDIGVVERMRREGVPLDSVCLLDPKAPKELVPEDGDGRFKWFLFGVRFFFFFLKKRWQT